MLKRNTILWIVWIVLTIAFATHYAMKFNTDNADKTIFLPGKTSHGHYQIELACNACHTEVFEDAEVMKEALQDSCVKCHGDALKEARDKHPKSKFTDPRNADRLAKLDARYCVTCHVEHRPEITHDMGLTLPIDYCFKCHEDIAEERPSHEGMGFETCASAGCHNYHDNQALYEDFLAKHVGEADVLEKPDSFPDLNFLELAPIFPGYPIEKYPLDKLEVSALDAPKNKATDSHLIDEWFQTAHANAGVNCTACHQTEVGEKEDKKVVWIDKPTQEQCTTCHSEEVKGFVSGKHGMRLDKENLKFDIEPMSPSLARLPMKKDAHNKNLSCNSCHSAHKFDTQKARVEGCLSCHNDEHSLAYIDSPHHELWQKEVSGEAKEGTGVTCASCHMPRIEKEFFDGEFYMGLVEHNQNITLKPNEKMLRPVCMNCHGLSFSTDSLADSDLIKKNFHGKPSVHINSIEMAEVRAIEAEEKRRKLREQEKLREQQEQNSDSVDEENETE